MIKEFKEFITRGNVIDLAVGVIMGSAFANIVTALTQNLIMPLLTIITGKVSVADLKGVIGVTEIPYGLFLQAVIDFLLTAIAIFAMIKVINTASKKMEALRKKKEEEPEVEAEPEISEETKLLTEIRDLLKNK
ncbi:MAG: large conductance mechanosensitive channel protein MscL [Eubacteriales bacterium]|nr:large conductance mechanosensitive channel protein MscL [Eubacteriales bacterium]